MKVTFFDGATLEPPLPPVGSKQLDARYVHLHEGEDPDWAQRADWIAQAALIPGWDGALTAPATMPQGQRPIRASTHRASSSNSARASSASALPASP